ncbi:MAG: hypothetical protein ACYCDN_02490 [Schaalia turicensis]|nr:hypothetical protein [Pauljensenia sp. UMB0895]
MSLDAVGTALDLEVQKNTAGKRLIKQFCTPATPSVLNGGGTRNLPGSDPRMDGRRSEQQPLPEPTSGH